MRIGVLTDTHIPDRTDEIPAEIFDLFRSVDLILHAGDVSEQTVLAQLETIAPVVAVQGNRDRKSLPWLPHQRVVAAAEWRIGLIHGTRTRLQESADRLRYLRGDHRFLDQRRFVCAAFAHEHVHCIVFGHTHQRCHERMNGILLFNPGGVVPSPGGGPSSVGLIETTPDGIVAQAITLRYPPRRFTLIEQVRRAVWSNK